MSQKKLDQLYSSRNYDSCIINAEKLLYFYLQNLNYDPLPNVYNVLAKALRRNSKYKEGLSSAKSSIYWAKKTNQRELLTILLLEVARNEKGLKKYNKAIDTYQEALDLCQKSGDIESESIALNNVGAIYKIQGKYTKAIQFYIKDAELNNKMNRPKDLAIAYNNIGQIHLLTKEYELAKSFFNRSKDIRIELNDEYGLALVSNNLGAVHHALNEFNLALDQFYIALATFDKFDIKYRVAEVYLNIADIYILKENYNDAIAFGTKGLQIFEIIKYDSGINRAYRVLGEANFNLKDFNNALFYLNKSLLFFQKDQHHTPEKRNIYKLIVKVYAELKNYKKAYESQSRLNAIELEFTEAANKKDLAFIHEKYNNRDQLLKIDKLQKEKKRKEEAINYQKQLNYSFSLIIAVLSVFGIYVYFINKKIRKAHNQIRNQNREIQEINNELTDSLKYASKIQQSLNSIPSKIDAFVNDYFIMWHPSQEVSGDVFNVSIVDQKIIISMLDCAGHGVPAALLATLSIKTLNQIIQSGITSPDKILTELDETMSNIFDQNEDIVGIDMAVVTIDMNKYTLEYSGARRPLLYFDKDDHYYIKGTKRSVCDKLSPFHYTFHKHKIPLNSDIKFYLYSDGLPDQFGGVNNKKFLEKKLRDLIINNVNEDFITQKENIEKDRYNWMNPDTKTQNKPTDDTLVMGFHIKV